MRKPSKNIIRHIISVLPGEINVKIGWGSSKRINKTLKVQVQLNRINIRYPNDIGNNTIGATTTPYMKIAFAVGIGNNVIIDKKKSDEVQGFDSIQFGF